jgi:hypothetical protein
MHKLSAVQANHQTCPTYALQLNISTNACVLCRLPGSNLLLGLPVVMDTNSETIREGQRVSNASSHETASSVASKLSCKVAL